MEERFCVLMCLNQVKSNAWIGDMIREVPFTVRYTYNCHCCRNYRKISISLHPGYNHSQKVSTTLASFPYALVQYLISLGCCEQNNVYDCLYLQRWSAHLERCERMATHFSYEMIVDPWDRPCLNVSSANVVMFPHDAQRTNIGKMLPESKVQTQRSCVELGTHHSY